METILLIALVFLAFIVTRSLTIIIHEFGHAFAGLILFEGPIEVYIGSYGKTDGGLTFKVGRLKVTFKYNLFQWRGGLCRALNPSKSLVKLYVFTLCGPLASLLVATCCIYILASTGFSKLILLGVILLLISSIIDLLSNISADPNPIILNNGTITYNDGQTLKFYRQMKGVYYDLIKLNELYEANKLDEGIALFKSLKKFESNPHFAQIGSALLIKNGNYVQAIKLIEKSKIGAQWNSDEYCNYALALSYTKEYTKAMKFYAESLKLNPQNLYTLNNRAYTNNLIANYEEAIKDCDKAIEINPFFTYSYNNRGLAKFKLGDFQGGLEDINKSIKLKDDNAYAYRNLGIYYFDIGDYESANQNFLKAEKLDPHTEGLDELIKSTKDKLNTL